METIQKVLDQNHSSKTKGELVEMMKDLQTLITPAEYEKISGVDPKNLPDLTKKEILDVVEDFQKKYRESWEQLAANKTNILKRFVKGLSTEIMNEDANLRALNAADSDFAAELGSIDFAKLIGGPLDACVTAQSNASLSTVNFIQEVGFTDDSGEKKIRTVDFSHKREVPDPNDSNSTITEDVTLNVPFLSILNIPSLRIETCEIDFNVKLNSVYSRKVNSSFGIDAGAQGGWGPVKFKVSVAYKRSSSTGVRVEKEYSMGVKVKATNDEIPAGLEKVLGILAE